MARLNLKPLLFIFVVLGLCMSGTMAAIVVNPIRLGQIVDRVSIANKPILEPIDPIDPIPEPIRVPILPKIPPITIPISSSAQTYKGITEINVPDGDSNRAEYFISFSKYTTGCSHIACYYGWVDNYTIVGSEPVQGYPNGQEEVKPVFQFKANSKEDFVLTRHPALSDAFADIIEVGCELLEPTIKAVSQVRDSVSTRFTSARALFAALSGQGLAEYTFIAESDFQRIQPKDTFDVDVSALTVKSVDTPPPTIQAATFRFAAAAQKIAINPEISELRVASLSRRLDVGDIQTRVNELQERITVDRDYAVVKRQRIVDLDIQSDRLTEENEPSSFVSNIKVDFNKIGNQKADHGALKKVIGGFSATNFSGDAIRAKRADPKNIKFFDEVFEIRDVIPKVPSVIAAQVNELKVETADFHWNVCQPPKIKLPKEIITPLPTPVPAPVFPPVPVDPIVPQKPIKPIGPILDIIDPIDGPLPIYKNLDLIRNIQPRRLLLETSIFTYQKQLFSKTILGKKFSVGIKIEASLIDNKNLRFRGVLLYNLFGKSKSVQIFNYVKDITFSWSKAYDLNGDWSFSVYVPLPPPVSFLGINFKFGVGYKIHVDLYLKGSPKIEACVYTFQAGANAETGVTVDASAAVRAIAIEGGVFISGELVKISTDPNISVSLNIQTKSISTKITWYFYLKAFYMEWGFFYRYWRLFKGWTGRKIIKKWPISNGITKKYLIYKNW